MRANKASNTRLEVIVRKEVWKRGYRGYRLNYKKLPGKPDIVFSKLKIAVFIHGCFWHSCPKCDRSSPKKNTDFWMHKFQRNKERDNEVQLRLQQLGWHVIVLWECDIKSNLVGAADRIISKIENIRACNNLSGQKNCN